MDHAQRARGAQKSSFVRQWMSRFNNFDVSCGRAVTIARDNKAAQWSRPYRFNFCSHGGRRFSRAYDDDPPLGPIG
jgi:hypothetical protein